jgi:hypothetical protein
MVLVSNLLISFIGIYRLRYGQPLSDLAPDGSYLQKYDTINQVGFFLL